MSRKVGRPSEKTDSREKLIAAAQKLFMVLPYDKVSIRMIAEKADVNMAMIRYYFGNKEGLFETMIREIVAPIKAEMERSTGDDGRDGLGEVMRTYYQTMIKTPQLPRLIVQIMNMAPSDMQRKLVERVFSDVTSPVEKLLSEKLVNNGAIRDGMDPHCCRVTFMSLMVFPFLAPPAMFKLHGIELNEAFLDKLLEHNIKVLSHGFQNPEQFAPSGENNEN
ncbi:TetR/AcrR family transcriptional regulator [Vibrio sp. JC009]|uniref:TetR/AcrR family transcriptional regulator n=1 Tax=Vibrio sp. JC009 TaxID=2912314 RepID=UPI0023B16C2C|nr:TetR/AcrR family transcriptional regulator [Vibrio sp. JC009]WED22158.1 TetR/AcrR family transcriptional regulator [Vibrio sp. JC009]